MRRFLFSSLCVVLIGCMSISAGMAAQPRKGAYIISAGIGGYHFESNQCYMENKGSLNPVYTVGGGVGYNFTDNWSWEVLFHYIDAEFREKTVDTYLYRLNFLYTFDMMDGKLVPFIAAGPGGISFNFPDQNDNTDFLLNAGAGLNYYLTERLALRGDIAQIITINPVYHNTIYTIGLSYLIGGTKKEVQKPLDTDGDGVIDFFDKCPGTPAGMKVDSSGCPPDSDKDGVYDYLDLCPETPQGVTVDAAGCPPDRDGDGFLDYLDKCPDVPGPGTTDGCPVPPPEAPKEEVAPPVRMRLNVEFDTNKADVKARYHDEIEKLAEVLKKFPAATVVLEGHTDSTGSDGHNLSLSQKRVDSVRNYLIDKFVIHATRITTRGYGETKPIADNATAKGRQMNRRVEAVIEY